MAKRRFSRRPPTNLCAEPGAEDGLDPRLTPGPARDRVFNRKALQLCRQVERALSVTLEGELLRDLSIESVVPAPDSSRLLITFRFLGPASVALADIMAALKENCARLRAEVASAIHRKKTPQLGFHVVR